MSDSTNKSTDNDNYRRVVLAEKLINAPVEKVWAACESGEDVEQWWQPKGDLTKTIVDKYEFKPGGLWMQHFMYTDTGTEIGNGGPGATFKEIVPYERIVTEPRRTEEEAIVIIPDHKETVISFERRSDSETKVTMYIVTGSKANWGPPSTEQGVHYDILDNLAKYVQGS